MILTNSPILVATEIRCEEECLFSYLNNIYDFKSSKKFNRLLGDIPKTIVIGTLYHHLANAIPEDFRSEIFFTGRINYKDLEELIKEFGFKVNFIIQTEDFLDTGYDTSQLGGKALQARKEFQLISTLCRDMGCVYIKQITKRTALPNSPAYSSSSMSLSHMSNDVYEASLNIEKKTIDFKNTKSRSGQFNNFSINLTLFK